MVEQRRHHRSELDVPLTFSIKGKVESFEGRVRDISVGGMFVETSTPAPFGSEIVMTVKLPGGNTESQLGGRVRWGRAGGMGIQFGLLGAKETHLITEIARERDR